MGSKLPKQELFLNRVIQIKLGCFTSNDGMGKRKDSGYSSNDNGANKPEKETSCSCNNDNQ
jgi:hypothetical protein